MPEATNGNQPTGADALEADLENIKKKYDIVKWVAGLAIGLIVGAFTVGVYFRSAMTYVQDRSLPPNLIAFFLDQKCPERWQRADELRGRYAVGVDPNNLSSVGKTVGSALDNMENRPAGSHTHKYVYTTPHAGGGRDRMMGGGSGGFDDPTASTAKGEDINNTPLKEGTNAPYVLLSACRSPGI